MKGRPDVKDEYKVYEHKMQKTIDVGGGGLRLPSGPAGPTPPCWTGSLVDYYGTPTPIQPGRGHLLPGSPDAW